MAAARPSAVLNNSWNGVSRIRPGATAFTLICRGASSLASALVRPNMAALLVA